MLGEWVVCSGCKGAGTIETEWGYKIKQFQYQLALFVTAKADLENMLTRKNDVHEQIKE